MSDGRGGRQAIAELRWDTGADPVVTVGGRSLHHYWPMLSPYFRDMLLPPLRRPEGNAVTWRWLEPVRSRAVTAAELRSMRKRLRSEQELLAENLSRAEATGGAVGMRQRMDPRELAAAMGGVTDRLAGSDDATLAGFVAHTEAGLRLHSWGAQLPAPVRYPDTPAERPEANAPAVSGATRVTSGDARARRRGWWWVVLVLGAAVGVGAVWRGNTRDVLPKGATEPASQNKSNAGRRTLEREADAAGQGRGVATRNANHAAKISEQRTVSGVEVTPDLTAKAGLAEPSPPGEATAFLNQPPAAAPNPAATQERGHGRPSPGRPDLPGGAAAGARGGAVPDGNPVNPAERVDGIENQHRARTEVRAPSAAGTDVAVRRRVETAAAADQAAFPTESHVENPLQDDGPSTLRKPKQAGPTPEATAPLPRMIDPETPRNASGTAGPTVLTIRIPHWRAQLLTDVILPTRPRRSGGPDEARALREQAAAEARARMPETLRVPQVRGGIGFEVGMRGAGGWWWQQSDGTRRQPARKNESRAELGWDDLLQGQTWVLAHETRGPQAEARREGNRVTVTLRGDVKGYQWAEIQITSAERGARWDWRRADGAPLPVAATARSVDASGRARIETPVEASGAFAARVAFFDAGSGWALIGEPAPDATARR